MLWTRRQDGGGGFPYAGKTVLLSPISNAWLHPGINLSAEDASLQSGANPAVLPLQPVKDDWHSAPQSATYNSWPWERRTPSSPIPPLPPHHHSYLFFVNTYTRTRNVYGQMQTTAETVRGGGTGRNRDTYTKEDERCRCLCVLCMNVYAGVYLCICIHICVCVCVGMCACVFMGVFICLFVCV